MAEIVNEQTRRQHAIQTRWKMNGNKWFGTGYFAVWPSHWPGNCCCCNQISQIKVLHASVNDQTGSTCYIQAHTFQGSFTKMFQRNHTSTCTIHTAELYFNIYVCTLSSVLLFSVISLECRKKITQICALLLTYSKSWKKHTSIHSTKKCDINMSNCVREQTLYFLIFDHSSGWT